MLSKYIKLNYFFVNGDNPMTEQLQRRGGKSPFRILPSSWCKTLIGAASALTLLLAPIQPALAASTENDQTLLNVYHLLMENHYSKPTEKVLLNGAIKGMLDTLDDPFTNYMSSEEYQDFVKAINQQYAGIGTTLEVGPDGASLRIVELLPNMPAVKAGLAVGDLITEIDGVKLTKDNVGTAPSKLRGQAGSTVQLGIVRAGKAMTISVTRASIELPTVTSSDLGSGIAYIRITSFAEKTADDFAQTLEQVKKTNPKGLVLDLRGNGGGYVQGALMIADLFLKQGPILYVHENGKKLSIDAEPDGTDLPLTVLIDGNTASASEMLAGALQRTGRAKLVGEKSYGKGTMQIPYELPDGSELKVSIDRWELPDGTNIDRTGLKPDVQMKRPDTAINAAMQLLLPSRTQTLNLTIGKTEGKLNGNAVTDLPAPLKVGNVLYMPLRFTFESFSTELKWNQPTKTISFRYNGKNVVMNLRSRNVTVNGKLVSSASGLREFNGNTYISSDILKAITGKAISLNKTAVTVYSK